LINSIGWNLGKKGKSNHLFEPLTSAPINGTSNNNIKDKTKKIIEILIRKFSLIRENTNIIDKPNKINAKCLTKK
tara:strand:+ start:307 stop:531 length:225 start_codon:yes stop_codon:yes gene_type:complete